MTPTRDPTLPRDSQAVRARRLRRALAAFGTLAVLVLAVGPRTRVEEPVSVPTADSLGIPTQPDELVAWLDRSEDAVPDLFEHARKQIVWADPAEPSATETVVVYLHGFSATRQEVVPLADSLAGRLGANLYYARLAGHGRPGSALGEVTTADWANDVAEAMAVAERLGNQVVLVGTSTGGTLAMWAATHPEWRDRLAGIALLSPNFGVRAGAAWVFGMPWGGWIAERIAGRERSWEPANQLQGQYWTTSYPVRSLAPMLAWVRHVTGLPLSDVQIPVWIAFSPNDQVVSPDAIEKAFDALGSPRKEAVRFNEVGDPSNHVLAGDILSPELTLPIVELIEEFLIDAEGTLRDG